MTTILVSGLAEIINTIDNRRSEGAKIKTESIWADFVSMSELAINAPDVLIVVNPPDFKIFDMSPYERQQQITDGIRDLLHYYCLANCDHLSIPNWEIEVIPLSSTGYGFKPDLTVAYSW